MNKFQLITNEVKKVINGKDRAVVTTLLALLTGGNILIEDIPGVGKTTLAMNIAIYEAEHYNKNCLLYTSPSPRDCS